MRQFVAEAMENLHLVALQVESHAKAPPNIGEEAVDTRWLAGGNVGIAGKIALVLARHNGRIKECAHILVLLRQSADKHTAVVP